MFSSKASLDTFSRLLFIAREPISFSIILLGPDPFYMKRESLGLTDHRSCVTIQVFRGTL